MAYENYITELDLSYKFIENKDVEEIAKALCINNSLQKLELWDNYIDEKGDEEKLKNELEIIMKETNGL